MEARGLRGSTCGDGFFKWGAEPLECFVGLAPVGEPFSGFGPVDGALRDPAHPRQSFLGQTFHTQPKELDHPLGVALMDGGPDLRVAPHPGRATFAGTTVTTANPAAASTP